MNKGKKLEVLSAKEKTEAVILSCVSSEHLKNAKTYLELFKFRFNDIEVYDSLCELYELRKEILNP